MGRKLSVTVKIKISNIPRAHSYFIFVPFPFSHVRNQSKASKQIKATSGRKTQTGGKLRC